MIRILWSILFILTVSYAYWIYINRDDKSLVESLNSIENLDSRIEIEDFVIYRYDRSRLSSMVKAKTGQFIEPNSVELFGEFRAYRYFPDGTQESIRSENAIGIFNTYTLVGLLNGAELNSAELEQDVRLKTTQYTLLTESAEYLANVNLVLGDKPVQVVGNDRWFRSKNGFRLDLENETIELYGKVNGESKFKK
ncbi:MAG: LPS export ABC transporter periplasmic protein LptC [Bdellovibrionota bacterium]